MARGLLVLFHPFENEMKEIHEKDVIELYNTLKKDIEKKRSSFEKHKTLTDVLNQIVREKNENVEEDETSDDLILEETTTNSDIDEFEKSGSF